MNARVCTGIRSTCDRPAAPAHLLCSRHLGEVEYAAAVGATRPEACRDCKTSTLERDRALRCLSCSVIARARADALARELRGPDLFRAVSTHWNLLTGAQTISIPAKRWSIHVPNPEAERLSIDEIGPVNVSMLLIDVQCPALAVKNGDRWHLRRAALDWAERLDEDPDAPFVR